MRGLDAAAVLAALSLVPGGLARPVTPAKHSVDSAFTTFVTLSVPESEEGPSSVTLRLDIKESEHACTPGSLKVNHQTLFQNSRGHGSGAISASGEPVITASWNFECQEEDEETPVGQLLTLTVHSINGEAIHGVTTRTWFRQTTPITIFRVDGALSVSRQNPSSPTGQDAEAEAGPNTVQLGDSEMQQILHRKENHIQLTNPTSQNDQSSGKTPTSSEPCRGILCALRSLTTKVTYTAGDITGLRRAFVDDMEEQPRYWDEDVADDVRVLPKRVVRVAEAKGLPLKDRIFPDNDAEPTAPVPEVHQHKDDTADHTPCYQKHPIQVVFFVSLTISAISFAFFALRDVLKINRRRSALRAVRRGVFSVPTPGHKYHSCHAIQEDQEYDESEKEEYCRVVRVREVDAELSEKAGYMVEEKEISRPASTTVEQEISGLVTAATLVDDLIAAGEIQRRSCDASPPSPAGSLPRYTDTLNDDTPPTYKS